MKKTKFILIIFLLSFFINNSVNAKNNYFSEGKKLFLKQDLEKSKFKFEKDIVFNPKNEESYLYLAKIYKLKENDKFEEKNLNTVILLNPKNEEATYLLALLKLKQSNYEKSKKLINIFKKVCKNICQKEKELSQKLKNLQAE